MKRMNFVIIIVVVSAVMGIAPVMRIGDSKFIVMMLRIVIGTLAIVYVICYHALFGMVKNQFTGRSKRLIR